MQQELEYFMDTELAPLKNIDGSYKNKVRACFEDLVMSVLVLNEQNMLL